MRAVRRLLREVGSWDPSQRLLRVVLLVAPVLALLVAGPAGEAPVTWVVALVLLLSLAWAWAPGSGAGSAALLVVLGWWTQVPDDALHPTALLAAVLLLVGHLAAVLADAAPPRTPIDPAVRRLWLLRGCWLLLVAPVLWVLARALRDQAAPAGLWPAALAVAVLLVVALSTVLGRQEAQA